MKTLFTTLAVLWASITYSQSEKVLVCSNDKIPHIEFESTLAAVGCCCNYSYLNSCPICTPPTSAGSTGRMSLTADSLFINNVTYGVQNLDSLWMEIDSYSGSSITATSQGNALIFAIFTIDYGSGVDHGNYWAFGIDFIEYPMTPFPSNKPICIEWSTGGDLRNGGFIPYDSQFQTQEITGTFMTDTLTGASLVNVNSAFTTKLFVGPSNVQSRIEDQNNGTVSHFVLNGANAAMATFDINGDATAISSFVGALEIESDITTFPGATYHADYSANFVDRTLVDKAYVDAQILYIKQQLALLGIIIP